MREDIIVKAIQMMYSSDEDMFRLGLSLLLNYATPSECRMYFKTFRSKFEQRLSTLYYLKDMDRGALHSHDMLFYKVIEVPQTLLHISYRKIVYL